jgi:hypothetical protein
MHVPAQDLQQRFNSRVAVDAARMEVVCYGGRASECAAAVRKQIEALAAGQTVYPHPKRVLYVLPHGGRWGFGPYEGTPVRALPTGPNRYPVPVYVLTPVHAEVKRARGAQSLFSSGEGMPVYVSGQGAQQGFMSDLAKTVAEVRVGCSRQAGSLL